MRCVHPLTAWQLEDGTVVFVEQGKVLRSLSLPCGQCIECRLERSRQWAVRCMHESQLYLSNVFVTLTYSDEHLPRSLVYRHFQLFMKRLRKQFAGVRFFACGEYGESRQRPHFHAILFNIHFDDLVLYSTANGVNLYTSKCLDSIWSYGFCTVGDVTFQSCQYVASYIFKRFTGVNAAAHYERVCPVTGEIYSIEPEFVRMSLKPGIGRRWFDKYVDDVFNYDHVVFNGREGKPPRYYDKLLKDRDSARKAELEFSRFKKAERSDADNSPQRLLDREQCTRARLSFKRRSL